MALPLTRAEIYLTKCIKITNGKILPLVSAPNNKTKIPHKCQCGHIWNVAPKNILAKTAKFRCPNCYKNSRIKTTEQHIIELKTLYGNVLALNGIYINAKTPTSYKCGKCNHIWMAKPNNILQGKSCPLCNTGYGIGGYSDKFFECDKAKKIQPGTIYLLKLYLKDETMLKIGITTDIKKRKRQYSPYTCEIITLNDTTLYDAYIKERHLKNINKNNRYIPKHPFCGYTECFAYDSSLISSFTSIIHGTPIDQN